MGKKYQHGVTVFIPGRSLGHVVEKELKPIGSDGCKVLYRHWWHGVRTTRRASVGKRWRDTVAAALRHTLQGWKSDPRNKVRI